jgi:hypothetical protein
MFKKKDRILIITGAHEEMKYKRYCKNGAADALNMLSHAVARELQYFGRNEEQFNNVFQAFVKGTLMQAYEINKSLPKIKVEDKQ